MEGITRKRIVQKAKSIYFCLRNLLCFFAPVDITDSYDHHLQQQQQQQQQQQHKSITELVETSDVEFFPFESLPEDCQRHVFCYLSVLDCGRASCVCRHWHAVLQASMYWSNVDLTVFAPSCECSRTCQGSCSSRLTCSSPQCYEAYKCRVQKYVAHLDRIQPSLRRLSFAFDIGDRSDEWLELLHRLLTTLHCVNLRSATLNWKETPVKSLSINLTADGAAVADSTLVSDLMSQHRRRQRIFTGFFEFFTTCATNLVELMMPFDWSSRSLHALSQLRRLECLSLQTYFVPQPVDQAAVDLLLNSVKHLRRLSVAVCVSSGAGLVTYAVRSPCLHYLDVSQCHGFYFSHIDMPQLRTLLTALRPCHGPLALYEAVLTDVERHRHTACIYQLLQRGTPQLEFLNTHKLRGNWRTESYTELNSIIADVCACNTHRRTD